MPNLKLLVPSQREDLELSMLVEEAGTPPVGNKNILDAVATVDTEQVRFLDVAGRTESFIMSVEMRADGANDELCL